MICECGWLTTWGAYLKSYQRKQLHGGGALAEFAHYLEHWPLAKTHRDKLLEIDRLIHKLHVNAKLGFTRPAALNVIEGTMASVNALLEELAYGDSSTPGIDGNRAEWKRRVGVADHVQEQHRERLENKRQP